MNFNDIYCVTDRLACAEQQQVVQAEQSIGFSFPAGYSDFVTQFGKGVYSGFVRIYMPDMIQAEYKDFQERWDEYYFWEEGADVLTKAQVIKSLIVGDTMHGDELILSRENNNKLYVLPRHSESIFEAGCNLYDALDWLCQSGELAVPIKSRYFESWIKRKRVFYVADQDADFFQTMDRLKNLIEYDKSEVESENDLYLQLFVPSIKGTVCLTGEAAPIEILIEYDEDTDSDVLKGIEKCLFELNFKKVPD